MKITFEVEGVGQVVKDIGIFDMERRSAAGKVVRKTTGKIGRVARSLASVAPAGQVMRYSKPGDLKSSIRSKYYHGDLVSVTIPRLPKGWTRNFIEKGTVQRTNKKGQNRGRIKPKPFMKPAREGQEAFFNKEMKKIWEDDETVI